MYYRSNNVGIGKLAVCLALFSLLPLPQTASAGVTGIEEVQQSKLTVKGQVVDESGEPVIGAKIAIKGGSAMAVTDADGNFTVNNLNSNAVLQISSVGFNTVEERVKGRTDIKVTMHSSVVDLNEVVAIGYGTQKREQITGSVANVSEANFNKGVNRDAADLLQGKVAGLQITTGSGDVTRGAQIRLRGTSTLQNDQGPMIVIDGVPGGDLTTVAPNDIQSISVLKDASSQAIYGSRAAGGVILITTKKGSFSQTKVSYNGYITADFVANKPDMLNAQEWRDANKQLGNDVSGFDQYTADTDWFDEMLRTGVSQNHSVSLSGGSAHGNYRASYTYLDRKGIARDNYMTRQSFRFMTQQRAINDKLRLSLTGSGTITDDQRPFADDYILAYNMLPCYPVYNEDGTYFTGANHNYDQGNPVQNQDQNYKKGGMNYFYGQGEVMYSILPVLDTKVSYYRSRFTADRSEWHDPRNTRGQGDNGYASKNAFRWDRKLVEWTLNYNQQFGSRQQHTVEGLLGYSWEQNDYNMQSSIARDFTVTSMGAYNIQTGNKIKLGEVTSGKNRYRIISFYARAHYSYMDRYMITATIRRDGSSKFGENHKWGWFPSVSAAWNIRKEAFMEDANWLDDLKLRVGYGVTGNQDGLRPYKSLELYEVNGTYYSNGAQNTAFRVSQNANPNLKWERTAMFNVGLDFELFKGRLSGTVEYYDKKTSDMLYNYSVPTPTYVYSTIAANVGDMSNKGIEVQLNWNVIRKKTFNWVTSLNLAHNKNEITKLSNDLYKTGRVYVGDPWIRGASGVTSHVVEVGHPVGQFFMLKCDGIDENGKFIIEDINKDGQITDDDRTYCGSSQPDLTFGWNNTFNFGRWDASIFFRGSIGNDVLDNPLAAYGNNTYISGCNAMKNDNLLKMRENSRVCSYYVEDASFVRLDNMSIGYTFNTSKIKWLDQARVYVAAQNLFVITGYKGLDPEVEIFRGEASDDNAGLSPGIEPRNYMPKARSFTFGVNLTF